MKNILRIIDQTGLSVLILLASDTFWYFASFLLAYYLRDIYGPFKIHHITFYLRVVPYVLLLLIAVFYTYGLYEQKRRINKISEIYLVTKSATITLILIMAASFLEKVDYSRGLILLFWGISIVLLNFGRYIIRGIRKELFHRGYGVKNILIIGAGKPGKRLAKKLEEYREFGCNIAGFLDDRTKPKKSQYKFLGQTKHLLEVIKKREIHEIYISDPSISHEKILGMIQMCENLPVKFKVVSDLFEIIAGGININEIEEIPAIDLKKSEPSVIYPVIKRMLDFTLSLIGSILFLPFFLIISIAIRLDSRGPAIFKHTRIGKDGKPFQMYKFRTMYQEVKEEDFSPRDIEDKRVTRVGRFLRKSSLDEVPQLWNVLKGEMSLVGPRPEMPFLVEKYTPWQKKRLDVKPGITGLWQILGRKDLPLAENIEYDFYYIKNRSLLLDLVIIFKTAVAVLTGRGAY